MYILYIIVCTKWIKEELLLRGEWCPLTFADKMNSLSRPVSNAQKNNTQRDKYWGFLGANRYFPFKIS